MTKKQIIPIAFIVIFSFVLSACKDDDNSSSNDDINTSVSQSSTSTMQQTTSITTVADTTIVTTTPPNINRDLAYRITTTAKSLLGVPFTMNSADPVNGFDNSGFIYYVLKQNNVISFPRVVEEQVKIGTRVSKDKMQSGDLVFFWSDDSSSPDFGGIYIGNGKMIACLSVGDVVAEVDITTTYYTEHFYAATSMNG